MIEPVEGLEILEAGLDGVRRRGEDISSSCCLMRADVGDVGGVIGSGEEGAATASPGVPFEAPLAALPGEGCMVQKFCMATCFAECTPTTLSQTWTVSE